MAAPFGTPTEQQRTTTLLSSLTNSSQ
jgi:hypothetical protein